MRAGDRVRVAHELGSEEGIVVGVAQPVARGEMRTITVKFADGTRSSWSEMVVEAVAR